MLPEEEYPVSHLRPESPRGSDGVGSGRQLTRGHPRPEASASDIPSPERQQARRAAVSAPPRSPSDDSRSPPRPRVAPFVWNDSMDGPLGESVGRAALPAAMRDGYDGGELSDSSEWRRAAHSEGRPGAKRPREIASPPSDRQKPDGDGGEGVSPRDSPSGGGGGAAAAGRQQSQHHGGYEQGLATRREQVPAEVPNSSRETVAADGDDTSSEPNRPARTAKDQGLPGRSGGSSAGAVVDELQLCSSGRLWTEVDDDELVKAMRESGAAQLYNLKQYLPVKEIDWGEIGQRLTNKISCVKEDGRMLSNKQIRDRWEQHLRPGLLKHKSLTLEIRREILQFVADSIDDETLVTRGRQRVQWVNIVHKLWAEGICCSTSTVKNIWNSYQSTLVRKQNKLQPQKQNDMHQQQGSGGAKAPQPANNFADNVHRLPPQIRYPPEPAPPMHPYAHAGFHDVPMRFPPPAAADRRAPMLWDAIPGRYLPAGAPDFPLPPAFPPNPDMYYGTYPYYGPMRAQHDLGYARPGPMPDSERFPPEWELQPPGSIRSRTRISPPRRSSPLLHGRADVDGHNLPEYWAPSRGTRHLSMPLTNHTSAPVRPPYPSARPAADRYYPSNRYYGMD